MMATIIEIVKIKQKHLIGRLKTKNALKLLNSNINKLDKLKSNDDAYIDPVSFIYLV